MANKEFEEKRQVFEEKLINLCKQVIGENMSKVDKLYIYCCSESVVTSFDFFTACAGKVRDRGHLGIKDTDFFDIAFEEIEQLKELCEEYGEKSPEAVKIIYEVHKEKKEVIYVDKPMGGSVLPSHMVDKWIEEVRRELEPKQAPTTKKAGKLINLKKQWNYKHEGLRGALMSVAGEIKEDRLTYFLEYDKAGFYESQLVRFDLKEKTPETLFTEGHVIRSTGVCENGRRYFTSMSAKVYCLDEQTGEVLWETNAGKGNASWKIVLDEKHVYMSNDSIYCIDKENGNILWESNEGWKRAGGSIIVEGELLYHGYSDGAVYCKNICSGELLWSYGKGLYPRAITTYGESFLLVAFVGSFGKVLLLDKRTGEVVSEFTTDEPIYNEFVVINNLVYIGNDAGEMYCLEITEDNQLVDRFRLLTDSAVTTNAAVEGEIVWFATEKGYIYGLNRFTGEEVAKKKKGAAGPKWIGFYEDGLLVLSDKGQVEYYQKA